MITFTAYVDTPQELRDALLLEIRRRFERTSATLVRAQTLKQSARLAGELSSIDGLASLLEQLVILPSSSQPSPLNEAVRVNMLERGYTYKHHVADFDNGDAENGPGTHGHPEYDEYTSADDYVIIDHRGHFAHYQLRDLEAEEFADECAMLERSSA